MLLLSLCGGVGVGWWGLHSHFHVQPNYNVEVVLSCRWGCDQGVTIFFTSCQREMGIRNFL